MPDDKLPVSGEIGPDEEAVARELAELGPLMRRQKRAEAAMPDPDFVRTLRARLMAAETAVPDPQFARDLRARLTGTGGPRRAAPRRTWRRAAVWAGLPAAALAVLVVMAIVVLASHGRPPSPGLARHSEARRSLNRAPRDQPVGPCLARARLSRAEFSGPTRQLSTVEFLRSGRPSVLPDRPPPNRAVS